MPPTRLEVTVEVRTVPLDDDDRCFALLTRIGDRGGFVPSGVVDLAAVPLEREQ